jgi:hypothetical protein
MSGPDIEPFFSNSGWPNKRKTHHFLGSGFSGSPGFFSSLWPMDQMDRPMTARHCFRSGTFPPDLLLKSGDVTPLHSCIAANGLPHFFLKTATFTFYSQEQLHFCQIHFRLQAKKTVCTILTGKKTFCLLPGKELRQTTTGELLDVSSTNASFGILSSIFCMNCCLLRGDFAG